MNKYHDDWIIAAPGILLLCFAFLVPVAGIMVLGIKNPDGSLTISYIERFLTDAYYLGVAWRTIKLSCIITLVCAIAGFPFAYVMARASPNLRVWLMILITLPLMTSVVVRTFGWMVLLGRGGLLPEALYLMGFVRRNYSLMHTEAAIIIGMIQILFPFMVLSIVGVILRLDPRIEEASRVMGCSFLASVKRVVLPLSIPGIVAGSLLVFTLSVSYFITPSLLGGARLPVLAGSIYETATKSQDWAFAAAQSLILFIGVLILLIPYISLTRKSHG
ncbi:ABC transporter permease [Bradyrhizobium sp. JYMT SZCCT0428]|uniref:ABC transporter permease n=1 Tax=Bradyrhizobium sp. JYMT SZCCT0428 TaxID=2807673 RepID=UPI001BA59E99|nr:ABC transporter permease [Bradyrhizobium sp. JYMT SZCCT0428]MBR1149447.1 ABC transporter permease [Bradyrhizobium sp. JYMT SZCCT0428]